MATYGKVVGGGLPVGILAGTSQFMDALDGGMWEYGDDSFPGVAPTFFAGTFVRHPLVLAAVRAVLLHVKEHGATLQATVTERTTRLVQRLNDDLAARGIATRIEQCGSLFYVSFAREEQLASLLYFELRARGVYALEGFPFFITTQHTAADLDLVATAFSESLDALQAVGLFGGTAAEVAVADDVQPTEEQTEIWLAAQLGDDASSAFNESVTLRLTGTLDEAAFGRAWNDLRDRHDALRATFAATGETMLVVSGGSFACERVDLSAHAPEEQQRELAAVVDAAARTAFDLVGGPLVRGQLVRLAPDDHAFVLTAHHIICDGWSINVLLEEFAAIYAARARNETAMLPAPTSFVDYARGQLRRDPKEQARVEKFWSERLADPIAPLGLPTDRPRPAQRTFAGATCSASISQEAYQTIKRAGARQSCTLFATLLAGFATLLGRLAHQRDVVVAVPAAGQSALGEDAVLVGHCVHLLPLRLRWNDGDQVADLLASTKRTVMDAYDHQDTTLGTLVRQLPHVRAGGRLPLTDVQFNLERLADGLALPGLAAQVVPNAKAYVNFDLFLNVIESRDGLRIDCDYTTDLFDGATIARWLSYYEAILMSMAADATTPIERLAYLPHDEWQNVLVDANATARAYPSATLVHELFDAQAGLRESAIAVRCGDDALTYGELAERVNRFARYLSTRTTPGDLIGIALARSTDVLVALLGTLKAGCVYVPLDRRHPAARLRSMLEEADVRAVVIDDARGAADIVPDRSLQIDVRADAAAIAATPGLAPSIVRSSDDLAYVIFTSGSTGRPKGVEISHRSVVNLLRSMAQEPGLGADDVLLAVTTVAFDIAALELFLPLTVGATVAIATNEETGDGNLLLARIEATKATAMQATPSTWRLLLEAGFRAPSGFTMLCGGEALPRDLANQLLAGEGRLWNMYGPTETTIWSSCAQIVAGDRPIDVGRPIANTQFYILDDHDQPVGVGQTGQLHIAGLGVACGYLNRDELTAEKFIANPFGPGRLYRTGDLARRTAAGDTYILGRVDQQVKLRGFRIELGEIESVLAARANVAASAVALREDAAGTPRLVGYIVERPNQSYAPAELAALLADALPEYMIPTVWIRLDALPLTANWKLDRNALPAPETTPVVDDVYVAPQTELETALARIWCSVLKRERVGTTDDLFALGADSINVFAIVARANREGIPLVAKQLLAQRTIRAVAHLIETAPAGPARGPVPVARRPVHAPPARDRVQTSA
jgi:amino acid adenylation domain-containing protein